MLHRLLFFLLLAGLHFAAYPGSNVMQIHDVAANTGETILVEIEIINDDPFVSFQVFVPLPAGFQYVQGSAVLNPDRENGHNLITGLNEQTNTLSLLTFSGNNATFNGNDGVVLSFSLNTPLIPGDYLLDPQDVIILGTSFNNILTGTIPGTISLTGFGPSQFILTLFTEGNGFLTVDGEPYTEPITFIQGATPEVTAIPGDGWHFNNWSGDHSGTENPLIITMNNHKTITSHFGINTYTITATAGEGGSISPEGEITVEHGSDTTFLIEANEGFLIDKVLVDGVNQGNISQYQFSNVTGNHTIEALFEPKTYTITATAGENGHIEPAGTVTVTHGAGQSFSIIPDTGYHVAQLLIDGEETAPAESYTFTDVSQDHTIHAVFGQNMYTITASAGEGGSIHPAGNIAVAHGANRTFTITPDAGHHILDVLVDDISVGATTSYTFTNITQDHSIHAGFLINTYTLTYTSGPNGTLAGDTIQHVIHGHSGTPVEAIPQEGYYFTEWSDGNADNPRTDTNVTANLEVTAHFAPIIYTLLYMSDENGSVQGDTLQHVPHGHDGTPVEGIPQQGYYFDQWSDGKTDNPRTDTNITADLEVTAHFAPNIYTLLYMHDENGSIQGDTLQHVPHGHDGTSVEAIPHQGYYFTQWSDGNTDNPRTDTGVAADLEVTAFFELVTYSLLFEVFNQEGVAITDATITLDGQEYEPGQYLFGGLEPGTYIYMVSRAGYFDAHGTAEITDHHITETVTLVPDDTAIREQDNTDLKVFPNPAGDYLVISARIPFDKVKLIDMTGRIVYSEIVHNLQHRISLGHLHTGIYILEISFIEDMNNPKYQHIERLRVQLR